jgi:hypothetical protein
MQKSWLVWARAHQKSVPKTVSLDVLFHLHTELTRTIQLKEGYRKHSRKMMKYSSQQAQDHQVQKGKRDRCSSVCN